MAGVRFAARRGPLLLAVGLGALCVGAAHGVWQVLTAPIPESAAPVRQAAERPAPLTVDVQSITAQHLFGVPVTQTVAPPTRAALSLGGIWFEPDGNAYALIGTPGQPQRPYRVGERLPGDIELTQVHPQHVLLHRDGREETLALPRSSLDAHPAGDRPGP
ncbi:type II secretion system protein N [Immundisolibacter sp.]|uniref:type II secretion system protein N n=1 Tax=Immundisolibacter sp. TaxID=1934948 RepID=UPI003F83687D